MSRAARHDIEAPEQIRSADDVLTTLLTIEVPRHFQTNWINPDLEFADLVQSATIGIRDDQTAGLVQATFTRPLHPSELRRIPWQKLLDAVVMDMVADQLTRASVDRPSHGFISAERAHAIEEAGGIVARRARRTRRRLTPELLEEVAAVYNADGAEAVADTFFVSQRQANRYIALAREEGVLP